MCPCVCVRMRITNREYTNVYWKNKFRDASFFIHFVRLCSLRLCDDDSRFVRFFLEWFVYECESCIVLHRCAVAVVVACLHWFTRYLGFFTRMHSIWIFARAIYSFCSLFQYIYIYFCIHNIHNWLFCMYLNCCWRYIFSVYIFDVKLFAIQSAYINSTAL